jgi:predicted small lipoprotein YifL
MKRQLSSWAALLCVGAAAACGERPPAAVPGTPTAARAPTDSAFALVQERGHAAMGVNQYTSAHRFESLPDGGRITLERDPNDAAGVAQIRSHMQEIAASFRRGDFAVPGFVHAREVPGTRMMRARRERISYTPETSPGGGRLRIVSRDSLAVAAIHEFLAFQRRDHRVDPAREAH